jgi:hypothetical protein
VNSKTKSLSPRRNPHTAHHTILAVGTVWRGSVELMSQQCWWGGEAYTVININIKHNAHLESIYYAWSITITQQQQHTQQRNSWFRVLRHNSTAHSTTQQHNIQHTAQHNSTHNSTTQHDTTQQQKKQHNSTTQQHNTTQHSTTAQETTQQHNIQHTTAATSVLGL